jgi:hypothetical protein
VCGQALLVLLPLSMLTSATLLEASAQQAWMQRRLTGTPKHDRQV